MCLLGFLLRDVEVFELVIQKHIYGLYQLWHWVVDCLQDVAVLSSVLLFRCCSVPVCNLLGGLVDDVDVGEVHWQVGVEVLLHFLFV